jgi:hypothetical protein
VSDVAAELSELLELATALNRLPWVDRRNPEEAWHVARDHVARGIARCVGRIRKELGIVEEKPTSFCAKQIDAGAAHVRAGGRAIPIERRSAARAQSNSPTSGPTIAAG